MQERRRVQEFDHDGNKSLYQAYCMRTASLHQNVHLQYYIADEGMESTDIIEKS